MNKIIARIGHYALRQKNYLFEHTYTTHEIEIVRYDTREDGQEYCYTIAGFNQEGELISYGNRLIEDLRMNPNAVEIVYILANIAYTIITETDEVNVGNWAIIPKPMQGYKVE